MDLLLLTRRVNQLEARLSAAEENIESLARYTGYQAEPAAPEPPLPEPPSPEPLRAPVPVVELKPPPLPIRPLVAEPVEEAPAFPVVVPEPRSPRPEPEPEITARRDEEPEPEADIEPAAPRLSLEARIGKNFAGWIGAIVLVLGVGFFLKYAWQHEWINPSPAARVASAVLAGFGLAGVGEYLFRKPMRGLAAVLYGAGVAVTMTAFFAAAAYFSPPVLGTNAAAALVLATAAGGIALALRADLPAMAILSLLGAYLSPLILRSGADQSGLLIAYLLLLAATGWALCLIRPRWHALRSFTFAASLLWYVNWYLHTGSRGGHDSLAFAYIAITYAGTLGELFVTLQRQFKDSPQAVIPLGTGLAKLEAGLAALSLMNTLYAAAGLYVLHRANQPLAGSLALGLAGIQGLVALAAFSRQLRYSALIQATALTTLAVPLLLSRFAINLAWLVMGVSMAVLNRRLDLRWPRAWATMLWVLAVGKLFTLDLFNPGLRITLLNIGTQPVTLWLLIGWTAAVAGHALGFLGRRDATSDRLGASLAGGGTVVFMLATAIAWGTGPVFTLAGLVWLTAIVGLRQQGGHIGYAPHAWTLLLSLAAKWLLVDGFLPTVVTWSARAGAGRPLVHLAAGNAVLITFLLVWMRSLTVNRNLRTFSTVSVCTIAFALANFETCRLINHLGAAWTVHDLVTAKQVALCALWSLAALALAPISRRPGWQPVRGVAVALFVVAMGRVMLFAADPGMREAVGHLGTHAVSRWMLMMVATGVAAHLLGWLTADRTEVADPSASALAGLGTLTYMAAIIGTWGFAPATTLAGIAWLAPIALLARRAGRINYTYHAWALTTVLACKWLLADGIAAAVIAYANPAADAYAPLLNTPTLCAILLAAAYHYLGRSDHDDAAPRGPAPRVIAAVVIAAMAFFFLNFETLRTVNYFGADQSLAELRIAKQVSLSILWSLAALATITAGFARHLSAARYAGLALLGVTLLKVLTVDMAGVETIWRILSFIAVGALLMCVSFVYYKHLEQRVASAPGHRA